MSPHDTDQPDHTKRETNYTSSSSCFGLRRFNLIVKVVLPLRSHTERMVTGGARGPQFVSGNQDSRLVELSYEPAPCF